MDVCVSASQDRWNRQALAAQKFWIEQFLLVAGTVVGEDRHDRMPGAKVLCQSDGSGNIDARRPAHAKTLVFHQIEQDRQRLFVGDLVGVIDRRPFEISRDPPLTDTLDDRRTFGLQHAGLDPAVDRGASRIGDRDADYPDCGPSGQLPRRPACRRFRRRT